jgi:hypothetical protein
MTDPEIRELFAGFYDHLRALHMEVRQLSLLALATKDTVVQLNPTKQGRELYEAAYKRHSDATKAADDKIIASIDAQIKDLRS